VKRKPVSTFISPRAEQWIRRVLTRPEIQLACGELVRRLQAENGESCTRQMAYHAVAQGERSGMLQSERAGNRKAYALARGWRRPEIRARRPNAGERAPAAPPVARELHRLLTGMPAMRPGPLVASLGVGAPDPEVMPAEIADLIDSLHHRFYRHACGVE
jgi:hypothetical protein